MTIVQVLAIAQSASPTSLPILVLIWLVTITACSWIAAKAVSAPNDHLKTCLVYAVLLMILAAVSEFVVGSDSYLRSKPATLGKIGWILCWVVVSYISSFWFTMRIFEVGIWRAFCIMVVVGLLSAGIASVAFIALQR